MTSAVGRPSCGTQLRWRTARAFRRLRSSAPIMALAAVALSAVGLLRGGLTRAVRTFAGTSFVATRQDAALRRMPAHPPLLHEAVDATAIPSGSSVVLPSVGGGSFAVVAVGGYAAAVAVVAAKSRRRRATFGRRGAERKLARRVKEFDAEEYFGNSADFYSALLGVGGVMFIALFVIPFVLYFNNDEDEDDEDEDEDEEEEDEEAEESSAATSAKKEESKDDQVDDTKSKAAPVDATTR